MFPGVPSSAPWFEVRTQIAAVCERMADEKGEPPLSTRA